MRHSRNRLAKGSVGSSLLSRPQPPSRNIDFERFQAVDNGSASGSRQLRKQPHHAESRLLSHQLRQKSFDFGVHHRSELGCINSDGTPSTEIPVKGHLSWVDSRWSLVWQKIDWGQANIWWKTLGNEHPKICLQASGAKDKTKMSVAKRKTRNAQIVYQNPCKKKTIRAQLHRRQNQKPNTNLGVGVHLIL